MLSLIHISLKNLLFVSEAAKKRIEQKRVVLRKACPEKEKALYEPFRLHREQNERRPDFASERLFSYR